MEGNITDRIVTSKSTLVDAGIFVADRHNDFIPFTDHRAIVRQLSHRFLVSTSNLGLSLFNPPLRQSAAVSHIKVPLKSEKDKYQTFQDLVDAQIKAESINVRLVKDDDSFIRHYKELGSIFKQVSEDVFGHKSPFIKQQDTITNKQIKDIVKELHTIEGAIHFEKSGHMAHILLKAVHVYRCVVMDFIHDPGLAETLLQFLAKRRQVLHKSLFAERSSFEPSFSTKIRYQPPSKGAQPKNWFNLTLSFNFLLL
jgi:hypothetical protein